MIFTHLHLYVLYFNSIISLLWTIAALAEIVPLITAIVLTIPILLANVQIVHLDPLLGVGEVGVELHPEVKLGGSQEEEGGELEHPVDLSIKFVPV